MTSAQTPNQKQLMSQLARKIQETLQAIHQGPIKFSLLVVAPDDAPAFHLISNIEPEVFVKMLRSTANDLEQDLRSRRFEQQAERMELYPADFDQKTH
jgi:hypothetical protein